MTRHGNILKRLLFSLSLLPVDNKFGHYLNIELSIILSKLRKYYNHENVAVYLDGVWEQEERLEMIEGFIDQELKNARERVR